MKGIYHKLFLTVFGIIGVVLLLGADCAPTAPAQFWIEADNIATSSTFWNHRIDYRANASLNPEVCFLEFRVELRPDVPGPGQGVYCHVPAGEVPFDTTTDTLDDNDCDGIETYSYYDSAAGLSVCGIGIECNIPFDNVAGERMPDLRVYMGDDGVSYNHGILIYPIGKAIAWGTCADGGAIRTGGQAIHGTAQVTLP